MVKTHHDCVNFNILMAVSAFFHPIFGYLVVLHRHGELLKQRPWMRIHWLPLRLAAVACALQALHVTGSISGSYAENYEKSQGMLPKIGCPKKRTNNFFVHIIYQNRNLV